MGVLINEFEVVPPSEGETGKGNESASRQTATQQEKTLQAADIQIVLERNTERRVRVLAH